MRYWVIDERDPESGDWGADAPDVPGCGAAASSREEVEQRIREALTAHLALLRADGDPAPDPSPSPWAEEIDIDMTVAHSV